MLMLSNRFLQNRLKSMGYNVLLKKNGYNGDIIPPDCTVFVDSDLKYFYDADGNRLCVVPDEDVFSPIDLPSLSLFLDASTVETDGSVYDVGTGAVSLWADKSGLGNDTTQVLSADQPVYDDINKQVLFTGSFLDLQPTQYKEAYFIVSNADGSTFGSTVCPLIGEMLIKDYTFLRTNSVDYTISLDGSSSNSGNSNINGDVRYSGGNITCITPSGYVGFPTQTEKTIVGFNLNNSALGEYVGASNLGTFAKTNISISKVLLFNQDLSQEERQKVEGWLAWNEGINMMLPDNHPYRYDGSLFGFAEEFNPSVLPNLSLWLDASTVETDGSVYDIETGAVSLWADKSALGNDAEQVILADQPIYSNNTVAFDLDELIVSGQIDYNTHNVFLVVDYISSGDILSNGVLNQNNILMQINAGECKSHYWTDTGDSIFKSSGIYPDLIIYHQQAQNSIIKGFVNGIQFGIDGYTNSSSTTYNTYIGSRGLATSRGKFNLKEVIIATGEITEEEKANVENYLNNKWNVY